MPTSLLLSLLIIHSSLEFEFLIEDGTTSFTSAVGMKELLLEVKTAITSTALTKFITTVTSISTSMISLTAKLTDVTVGTGDKFGQSSGSDGRFYFQ